jgi:hypothetical protein
MMVSHEVSMDGDRFLRVSARQLTRLLIVSCLSGALLGVAARVTMRFVALEAGVSAGFSVGGSLEVVGFGVLIGTPVALLFFAVRAQGPRGSPWLGLLCGVSLFGVLSAVPPTAARSALAATPDTPVATVLAFGVLFVSWGAGLEYVARVLTRPVAAPPRPPP